MSAELVSTGLCLDPELPMIWACVDQQWTSGNVHERPLTFCKGKIFQRLPPPLRKLIEDANKKKLVAYVQVHGFSMVIPEQNRSTLTLELTKPDSVSSAHQIAMVVNMAVALCGVAVTRNALCVEERNVGIARDKDASNHEMRLHQLHLHWQFALRHIVAR